MSSVLFFLGAWRDLSSSQYPAEIVQEMLNWWKYLFLGRFIPQLLLLRSHW